MSRLLLATNHLFGWTGSELTIATLAAVLRDAGHEVLVYAPFWSRPDASRAFLGGVPATQSLVDVAGFDPQAAYTQHHPVATAVRATLPDCPIAHAILGVLPYLERPPHLPLGVDRYLPISEETRDALLAAGGEAQQTMLWRNLVDDSLFTPGDDPLPTELQTVACYSYKLEPGDLQALQAATAQQGLTLRTDTNTRPGDTPYADAPRRVRAGEIVVASGRGAIEAMLSGRVPLILANCGDDGLVTPANFTALMRTNFSGRSRGGKLSAPQVAEQIARYCANDAAALRQLALQHFGVTARRAALLDFFSSLPQRKPKAMTTTQRAAIAFESEGLELQRQFATQAVQSLQRVRVAAGDTGRLAKPDDTAAWSELLRQGNSAWTTGDVWKALDLYLTASRGHASPAPMRRAASLVLVELAERERLNGASDGRRAALEAILSINPDHTWARAQRAECEPSEHGLNHAQCANETPPSTPSCSSTTHDPPERHRAGFLGAGSLGAEAMANETSTSYARALSQSTPAFYWFRDHHTAGDGKISIRGIVASNAAIDRRALLAQVNGIPARLSWVSMASQADDRFWFLPATHRAGVVIEAPLLAGTTSAAVTLLPRWLPREHAYRHAFHLYFDHTQVGVTPPVENIERVSGKGATAYNYFNNGASDFHRFVGLAAEHGIDALDARTRILDWGSGCARLTRHLLALPSGRERVSGADIDHDNVDWSRLNIDEAAFHVVDLMPPTKFADHSFDLVLANSVLSHLTEPVMHAWLAEVNRVLRPGGLALLSYHGDFSLAGFCARAPGFVDKVWQSGFNDDQKATELDTVISDTTYYRQTFMTDDAAMAIFSQHLAVEGFVVGMVSRFQNVAVLRRPAQSGN